MLRMRIAAQSLLAAVSFYDDDGKQACADADETSAHRASNDDSQ